MRTEDFNYNLPKSFIAQTPTSPRDSSKLMVFDTATGKIYHKKFSDIKDFLTNKDVLVLNRSKVIPARVTFDNKEVFILKNLKKGKYQALVRPGKYFKKGKKIFLNKETPFTVVDVLSDGSRILQFQKDINLNKLGVTPLPPYIKPGKTKDSQYQTVYAKESGSVAAPTAGLHFTKRLLKNLKSKNVEIEEVILHVGRGTFIPVTAEKIEDHKMHSEEIFLEMKTAQNLNKAEEKGKRIIAVGTTSVRVLESRFLNNKFVPGNAETDIFIYPGKYQWKAVDALVTNFHLPKSTLIMLVASFLENKGIKDPVKKVLALYELAKKEKYRFFSFGDAMFIY